MPTPLSPEILLSLSPPILSAFLSTFASPAPATSPPFALARALFSTPAPTKLARVTPFLTRFATDTGKRAFIEAARASRDARADAWLALGAADLAATIAVELATAKGKPRRALQRIADLALLRVERELPERPTYELMAAAPVAHDAAPRALARGLRGAVGEPWVHTDADGALHVAIFLRAPVTTRLTMDRKSVAARTDENVTVDLVRVWPDGARVAITAAVPERLAVYVEVLGLSLRPSLTLKPLHDCDDAKLARLPLPRGVRGVRGVAARRRAPDGARAEFRATDALSAAQAHAPRGGYLDRTTIRVDLGDREADAFLQLPHRVEIADRASDAPVRATLAAIGNFEPGALPDDARSLAPYEHGDWRWRAVVKDTGFEWLVANGRLARVEVAHVATEEHRMLGASYVVRAVPGAPGVEYALAEDRAYGARLVGKDERVAWRLDRDALAKAMRADLGGATVTGTGAIAIDGVLDLGLVALKSGKLRFVYAMATPAKGWLEALRRACGIGVTLVVLVPRGHAGGIEGVLVVELDVGEQLGVKRIGRALGRAAEALGVEGEIEPWRTCEEEVVIEAGSKRVWVLGVLVTLSEKPYRFLECLARSGGVMTTKEIGPHVSAAEYPDEAARHAKMVLEKQVAAALVREGVDGGGKPLIVTEGKNGYRLGRTARVVEAAADVS